jgi:hypothetical protein
MTKFSIYMASMCNTNNSETPVGTARHHCTRKKVPASCFIWEDLDLPDHWISSIIPIINSSMEPISASSAVQQMIGRYKEHGFVGFRLVKTYQAVTSWPWSLSLIHWSPTLTCQHWQYTGGWSWLCTHNTITMNTLGLRHEPA